MTKSDFLKKIVEHKKELIARNQPYYERIKDRLEPIQHRRYRLFKEALVAGEAPALIAEIKKASPSKGVIREDFDLLAIARSYEKANVSAISVLTEDRYFLGQPKYITMVRDVVSRPLLTKDFIIDGGQIYEAAFNGASAVLLIMALLDDRQVRDFIDIAGRYDLDCLVEVHDQDELKRALDCGSEIIGINNRDLKTFQVSLDASMDLMPQIPNDKVIVAESGINTYEDIQRLVQAGADAVLIGEAIMREDDIKAKIKELLYG